MVLEIFRSVARVYVFPHRRHSCPNLRRRRMLIFQLQSSRWNIVHLAMSSVSQTDDNLRVTSPASMQDAKTSHQSTFRSDCIPHVAYIRTHLLQAIPSFKHCKHRTMYHLPVKFLQCYRTSLRYISRHSSSLCVAFYIFYEIGKVTFGTSLITDKYYAILWFKATKVATLSMLSNKFYAVLPDVQKVPYKHKFFEMCRFLVQISKKYGFYMEFLLLFTILSLLFTFNCKGNYFAWFFNDILNYQLHSSQPLFKKKLRLL